MDSIYYAVKATAALWVVMIFFILAIGGNKSEKNDRFSKYLFMITLSAVLPTIGYSVGILGQTGPGMISWGYPMFSYSGFFLIVFGVVIHWIGILTLKKQWSTVVVISEDHELVDTGIYRFIRHPIYAAILLELLGFGLALANWVSILLLLVPNGLSVIYRICVEEKVLEKHFGQEYVDYERRTKRMIPGIF